MQKKSKHIILLLTICFCIAKTDFLFAQTSQFQVIKGLPTNEVYDLMIDSKGLLWIAHDLGVSSYDGKTFKHYRCPDQQAKSITGLMEDKQGRIWCHNFYSQIFWIKDDVMHLLKEYNFSTGYFFPKIAIVGDRLIATTTKGFFEYDLITGRSQEQKLPVFFDNVMAVSNDRVIALLRNDWALYEGNGRLKFLNVEKGVMHNEDAQLLLQPVSNGDTMYVVKNPENLMYRFIVKRDSVFLIDVMHTKNFINCVTRDREEMWIHTKTESYCMNGGEKITGYNLTDIITDKEGNRWLSSLKYGLMLLPKSTPRWLDLRLPLKKGDYVRSVITLKNKIFWGTQAGDVFVQDSLSGKNKLVFSQKGQGAIEQMTICDSTHIIFAPSLGLYAIDVSNNAIKSYPKLNDVAVKDAAFSKNYTAVASHLGLILAPNIFESNSLSSWQKNAMYGPLKDWRGLYTCWELQRCRSVLFTQDGKIMAAFKDAVVLFTKDKRSARLLFDGKDIHASILLPYKDKVFIGTVADDLLVYDQNGIHSILQGSAQEFKHVLQVLLLDRQLLIITTYGIRVMDVETEKITGYYNLSGINPATITNISRIGDKILIITNEGVYTVSEFNNKKDLTVPSVNLLYTTINGMDTVYGNNHSFSYKQSDVSFYVSAPWYTNVEAIGLCYRLIGDRDSSWKNIDRSDQPIRYSALMPGEYNFEIKAINRLNGVSSEIKNFAFTIRKPWWQLTWFWVVVSVITIGIVILLMRKYYAIRLQRQKRFYEQELALEKERQRISADIHDELGGTLSGIKLMTEMTERKYDESGSIKGDLHNIHTSVSTLSQKMREVIWSLNNENNSLENLLDYLLRRGKEMFQNSDIQFHSQLPKNIPAVQLKGDKRRHIYLAVKEALHNVLKHSNAADVHLSFEFNTSTLNITVSDNGGGFITSSNMHGNGIRNMHARMEQVNGLLLISKEDGVTLTFVVPLVANTKRES